MERPSFDGLEALLVLGAPETVAIKLGSGTGPFSRGVPPRSLRGKLSRSHFLRGQTFGKLVYKKNTNHYEQEPNNTYMARVSTCALQNNHIGACAIL